MSVIRSYRRWRCTNGLHKWYGFAVGENKIVHHCMWCGAEREVYHL